MTTLFVGAVLSEYLSTLVPSVSEASTAASTGVQSVVGVQVPGGGRLVGTVLLMGVLSFVWGVGYHFARYE